MNANDDQKKRPLDEQKLCELAKQIAEWAEPCKVAGLVRNKARDVRTDDNEGDGNADEDEDEKEKRNGFRIDGGPRRQKTAA